MDNRIDVSDAIWQWVEQSIPLSNLNAGTQKKLQSWISREALPTFNQIEALSKAIHVPIGYFFLQNPPKEACPVLEYRTVDSAKLINPSRNLLDTVRLMEDIQDWMRDHLINESAQPVLFVNSIDLKQDIHLSAIEVRKVLSLSVDWYTKFKNVEASFKHLRTTISDVGVLVMLNGTVDDNTRRPLDLNEFRAFSLLDSFAPLIFINGKDSIGGRLFSLLHEFVHIGIGEGSLLNMEEWGLVSPLETFCNKVVAEILVPEAHFRAAWNKNNDDIETQVSRLAIQFRCSQSVIVHRCRGLGLISENDYSKLRKKAATMSTQGSKTAKGGGDYWATKLTRIDHRLIRALETSLNEGKTSYTEAFKLTNTNLHTFEIMIDKMKGELV